MQNTLFKITFSFLLASIISTEIAKTETSFLEI